MQEGVVFSPTGLACGQEMVNDLRIDKILI